jgi:hypothetical protein
VEKQAVQSYDAHYEGKRRRKGNDGHGEERETVSKGKTSMSRRQKKESECKKLRDGVKKRRLRRAELDGELDAVNEEDEH